MKIRYVFFILTTFLIPGLIYSGESIIHIKPEVVNPGDIFIVMIKSKTETPISAEICNRIFYFSSCGTDCNYAIGAIDILTTPGMYELIVKLKDNKTFKKRLKVKKTQFSSINIKLPEDIVTLSPQDEARAAEEERLLKAIWEFKTPRLWKGRFIKPVSGNVSTGFGIKRIINNKKISIHRGVDFEAMEGDPVIAVNNGRVIFVGELLFGGKTIVIDHGDRLFSVYMHLSGHMVNEGDLVSKGDVVGFAGSTGRATGPHLHFTFKVGDLSVNPEKLFDITLMDML